MSLNKWSAIDVQVLQSVFSKLIVNVAYFVEGVTTLRSQGSDFQTDWLHINHIN